MVPNGYSGHFITTFTGRKFHYLDPQPDEICIEDIAHALALTCRFGGMCREFYSVADHSIRVAEILPPELRLAGLLHDAHEAYLHDILRPIKQDMPIYREIANKIQDAIDLKFDTWATATVYRNEIKAADNILLATEARDLMANTEGWVELPKPQKERIKPRSMEESEWGFLRCFEEWE